MELRTSQDELNKEPDFPVNDLEELREFVRSSPELPNIPDKRLIQFHFACYYNMDDTKRCIRTYYDCFKKYTDFFDDRRLAEPSVNKIKALVHQYASPVRTPEDSQIIVAKLVNTDTTHYTYDIALKYFIMAIEASIHLYGVAKHTEVVIDYRDLTFRHMLKVNIGTIRKIIKVYEEALPIRAKAIHIINVNFYISKIVNIARPFVSKELFDKVKFYTEDQIVDFRAVVPESVLPKEFGGTLGSLASLAEKFEASLSVVEPFFKEEEKLVAETES
ncbi:clavesin-2 isoform X2 [Bemisia tabaci]|nr:PREDICTED: clavesin-2-like isoform X2 [Bemisia tabaci]